MMGRVADGQGGIMDWAGWRESSMKGRVVI